MRLPAATISYCCISTLGSSMLRAMAPSTSFTDIGCSGRSNKRCHRAGLLSATSSAGPDRLPRPGGTANLTSRRLHDHRSLPLRSRGHSVEPFLLLPGAHAVGHAFVKVSRAYGSFYAPEPQPLSHLVAHAGEGEGDALTL